MAVYISDSISGLSDGYRDNLDNSGTINGLIYLDLNDDSITNTGTINGSIYFGSGDDMSQGRDGILQGIIFAATGSDTLEGGIANEDFRGGSGDDIINLAMALTLSQTLPPGT